MAKIGACHLRTIVSGRLLSHHHHWKYRIHLTSRGSKTQIHDGNAKFYPVSEHEWSAALVGVTCSAQDSESILGYGIWTKEHVQSPTNFDINEVDRWRVHVHA